MDYAISVIVPIYNAQKWLHRCINSILHQPFLSFELILVNDGSFDECGVICEDYAAKDIRIKVIHKPNGGVSSAKNTGIEAATGKYIAFIDPDDEISELYFVKLYAAAEEHHCDAVIGGYQTVPTNRITPPAFKLQTLMNGKDLVLSSTYVHSNNDLCFAWKNLYSRNLLQQNKIRFHEKIAVGEDTIFNLEALLRSERVIAIPDPLYFYTVNNPDSIMSSPYKPLLESSLQLQYTIRKRLSDHSGLLQNDHYRKDMANYYLKSIYRMLVNNLKNNPAGSKKSDLARIVHYDMFKDSAREIGYFYKCNNLKEYMYYLALKYKFYALIYDIEFHPPRSASVLSFLLNGRKNASKKYEQ